MAGKSITRRIVTWPRLLYLGIGFVAGMSAAMFISRPSEEEILAKGIAGYVTERAANDAALLSTNDCKMIAPDPQRDAQNVAYVVACTWDSGSTTNIFESGYSKEGRLVFTSKADKDKVSN